MVTKWLLTHTRGLSLSRNCGLKSIIIWRSVMSAWMREFCCRKQTDWKQNDVRIRKKFNSKASDKQRFYHTHQTEKQQTFMKMIISGLSLMSNLPARSALDASGWVDPLWELETSGIGPFFSGEVLDGALGTSSLGEGSSDASTFSFCAGLPFLSELMKRFIWNEMKAAIWIAGLKSMIKDRLRYELYSQGAGLLKLHSSSFEH